MELLPIRDLLLTAYRSGRCLTSDILQSHKVAKPEFVIGMSSGFAVTNAGKRRKNCCYKRR